MVDIIATLVGCSYLIYAGSKRNSWSRSRTILSVAIVGAAFLFIEVYDHWESVKARFNTGLVTSK